MPGRLARHALWNFLGLASPMLMAVAAIPPLIRGLGVERFGVLTLAWTLIGYLSLFDLGLGRALTKLVADGSGTPGTVRTALALLGGLGAAGGLLMAAIANRLTGWLHIPEALQAETVTALYLVAAAIPLVTLTAGWRGVLEARRRFGALGLLRAAMGILMFALPLGALRFSPTLPGMLLALWLARAASLAAHAWLGLA
ncbi:MAG: hypothetical protein HYR60_08500 [Acidobacteria bacterium]|nr:hypothetical protein [Acidobacteriota bacterium]